MPKLSIEKISDYWTNKNASHLLRRTLIGPTREQILNATNKGLDATINTLLDNSEPFPSDPINYKYDDDPSVPIGTSWVSAIYSSGKDYQRRRSYNAWETGNLIQQSDSIRIKMSLFWYNHFVTEATAVGDTRAFFKLIHLFKISCLDNFKDLVKEVTTSTAMLIYLNGNANKNTAPNENYARELLELFTIGKGALIGEGNYTNYTESDIAEAAKVLTGFTTIKKPLDKVEYKSSRHDKSTKQFSSAFDFQTIENAEENEYELLVDMILSKKETARFITRKIYRWFLYHDITPEIEQNIIIPLADIFYDSDYEIKPMLRTFFSSIHFHDEHFWGTQVKSPIDFNIGIIRQLKHAFPVNDNFIDLYSLWYKIYKELVKQQQDISNPPDVSGWKAYYQEPLFYRTWVNSVTLPLRQKFVNSLLNNEIKSNGIPIAFDAFEIVNNLSIPNDPTKLIEDLANLFYQMPLSAEQNLELKEVLIPGLPDFEWTVEYGEYSANPGDKEIKRGVEKKLISLITAMLKKAEYQLV